MSATAPNYGMKAPKEMLDLANRPGYLKERQGGNRLREFWNDLSTRRLKPFVLSGTLMRYQCRSNSTLANGPTLLSAASLVCTRTSRRFVNV